MVEVECRGVEVLEVNFFVEVVFGDCEGGKEEEIEGLVVWNVLVDFFGGYFFNYLCSFCLS